MSGVCSFMSEPVESANGTRLVATSALASGGARSVSVDEGYKLWAPTYDNDPNPLVALEERRLLPYLDHCRGKNVLDVACGTGRWLSRFIGLGARSAVGIDLSPAMLEIAAAKPLLMGRLARGDGYAIPIRSGAADLILCSFALSHLSDPTALAKELTRIARPNADVFVSDLHPSAYLHGWRTGFRTKDGPMEIESVVQSLDEVRDVFAAQNLKLIEFEEPHLGGPERQMFEMSGRAKLFDEAAMIPAVMICHFTRSVD